MASALSTTFSRTCFAQNAHDTATSPYMTFRLESGSLRRLVIKILSNEGLCFPVSDPTASVESSNTWFAFGLVQEIDKAGMMSTDDLIEFQRNTHPSMMIQNHVNEWIMGVPVDDDGDVDEVLGWLESLTQVDNVEIGVFPLTQRIDRINNVWKMEIETYLSDRSRSPSSTFLAIYPGDDRPTTILQSHTEEQSSTTSFLELPETADIMQLAIDALGEEIVNEARYHSESFWRSLEFSATAIGSAQVIDSFIKALGLEVDSSPQDHRYRFLHSIDGTNVGPRGYDILPNGQVSTDNISPCPEALGPEEFNAKRILATTNRGGKMDILANSLFKRFIHTEDTNDINRAIHLWTAAVNSRQWFQHGLRKRLDWLAGCYVERARVFNLSEDLDRAVELTEKALHGMSRTDPVSDYPDFLMKLASRLGRRHSKSGSTADLNHAVETAERSLRLTPEYHWSRPHHLGLYGELLLIQFKRSSSMEDLMCAIEVFVMALDLTPDGDHLEAGLRGSLAECFENMYAVTGSVDHLNKSVDLYNASVASMSSLRHPLYVDNLCQWGIQLSKLHEHTGSMADIDQSIQVLRIAMNRPIGQMSTRASVIMNLASSLFLRYVRTDSDDDIQQAIDMMGDFIPSIPRGHSSYSGCVSNLGLFFSKRFQKTRVSGYLDIAIELELTAVQSIPQTHPCYALHLNNLASGLFLRFGDRDSTNDLDAAIETLKKVLVALPQNHPERAMVLENLVRCYVKRGAHTIDDQRRCALEGWNCQNSPPSVRISLALVAAGLLNLESKWEESSKILEAAVSMLPSMSPRGLKDSDQRHMLQRFPGLASMAAATALNSGQSPIDALRLLESGRGVMAALLLETRTDISDLKQSHPDLATSFVSLRDKLDSGSNWTQIHRMVKEKEIWEPLAEAQQHRDLEGQFNQIITKIRTNPGFEDFLLPPKTEDLLAAASLGPIVVLNASIWSCDAFIITSRSIEALRLPPFLFSNFRGSIQSTSESLEDIWMRIAKPVLDFLGFDEKPKDGEWPHVWWIPTGSLSRLPIHAAGVQSEDSSEAVIDRVISSYSTSIKALLQARRRSVHKLRGVDFHTACLVSMSTTPSRDDFHAGSLEFAEEEVQMLDRLLSPTTSTKLMYQPNKEDVLRHIESCTAFHFAGHGVTDPLDPSKSCLLLNDWVQNPLTVDDLTSLNLYERSPWLAYLSACSTGENQTEGLQDESIHLASACQLAGFPHVVASLWKIDDECSAEAAAEVYKTIQRYGWTDESVALGVHNATRLLRSKTRGDGWTEQPEDIDYEESFATTPPPNGEPHEMEGVRGPGYAVRTEGNPMIWAAYIHVGP